MNPKELALVSLIGVAALSGCGGTRYPLMADGVAADMSVQQDLDQAAAIRMGNRGTNIRNKVFDERLDGLRLLQTLRCNDKNIPEPPLDIEIDAGNLKENKKVVLRVITAEFPNTPHQGIVYLGDSQDMHLLWSGGVDSISLKTVDGPSSGEEIPFRAGVSTYYELLELKNLDKNGLAASMNPISYIGLNPQRCR